MGEGGLPQLEIHLLAGPVWPVGDEGQVDPAVRFRHAAGHHCFVFLVHLPALKRDGIAAAHAACYAMAFSNTLDKAGSPPERLNVTAVCALDRVDGKMKIVSMDLNV